MMKFKKFFSRKKKDGFPDKTNTPRLSTSSPMIRADSILFDQLSASMPTTARSEPPLSSRSSPTLPQENSSTTSPSSSSSSSSSSRISMASSTSVIPSPESLRRRKGQDNFGEIISLEEAPYEQEIPEILLRLGDYVVAAICEGFSNLYLLRRRGHHQYVMVKVSHIENRDRIEPQQQRAIHELCISQHVSNPIWEFVDGYHNIVQYQNVFCFPDDNFLLMTTEYCRYGSILLFMVCYEGCITTEEKVQIAEDFTRGIAYLHRMQVAHRDIKLDNILLAWSDREHRVVAKIADFGASSICTSASFEASNMSSPHYMAPELINRSMHNPISADLWAWAIAIYAFFEGLFPFGPHENNINTRLVSNDYSRPQVMHNNMNFERLLNPYFTYDQSTRPSLCRALITPFFRTSKKSPITERNVDALMQSRADERKSK